MADIRDTILLENLLKLFPAGIFWKDKDRRFLGANQMFLDYYGLKSVDDLLGKNDEDMGWHIDPEPFRSIEINVLNTGESVLDVPGECIVKGKVRKIRASKYPMYSNGEIVGLVGYFMDITDELEERDRLSTLCQTDDLTGILNRRAYNEIIREYEKQYLKTNEDFVLFMMDIDDYKEVNDTYGHEYGDHLLVSVAKSLSMAAGDNSVLCRYGGDEFVIIHKIQSDYDVEFIEKRILREIRGTRLIEGVNFDVRMSTGYARYSESGSLGALEELADKRMYEMKKRHKAG